LGVESCGEVVRVARWSFGLGLPPSEGFHFKIVLLQDRPKLGLPTSLDRKTTVCVPPAITGRQADRIIGEINGAKQAAYLTPT
jgi:hypothetical protein